jgi:hypothetical protein
MIRHNIPLGRILGIPIGLDYSLWIPSFSRPVFGKFVAIARFYLFGLLLGCALASCSPNVTPFGETEYTAKILGDWRGTVGDTNETVSFGSDGTFVSQVRPRGFISNTLSRGVTGTIRGTWTIKGKSITMNVTGAEDEKVLNKTTTSTIEAFRPNELIVKSSAGDTSTFVRR